MKREPSLTDLAGDVLEEAHPGDVKRPHPVVGPELANDDLGFGVLNEVVAVDEPDVLDARSPADERTSRT